MSGVLYNKSDDQSLGNLFLVNLVFEFFGDFRAIENEKGNRFQAHHLTLQREKIIRNM